MGNRDRQTQRWHALFDAACLDQGHIDNAALATAYCAAVRNTGQAAYESALKNLNNWRRGVHTPSRRNFRVLTSVLKIDDRPEFAEAWYAHYEEALRRKPAADAATAESPPARPFWHRPRPAMAAGLILALAVGGISAGLWAARTPAVAPLPPEGPPVIDMTGERIYWRELTEIAVGQSAVIHGKRGRCAEQPPSWEEVLSDLPYLATGVWSDGGVGHRSSRACGGTTPARAVVFTATIPGEENFLLFDDPITLRVLPADE